MGNQEVVSVWEGVVTGEILIHAVGHTSRIDVFFLDHEGHEFQPEESEFTLGAVIGDPAIAGYVALSQWAFRLEGLADGMTDITLSILHDGHADFTSPPIPVTVSTTTGVPEIASGGFRVLPNTPNPFNPSTEIRFRLEGDQPVSVRIFDMNGRLVRTLLANEIRQAGENAVTWDGTDDRGRAVGSGMYFSRIDAGARSGVNKMMLLK